MSTSNRGGRQSEYQRSIAGAGNVRAGGDERYGDSSRGFGQDVSGASRQPLGGGNGGASRKESPTLTGRSPEQFRER